MDTIPSHSDDEIDLFELIKTIWDGKLWVIIATLLTTSSGAIYTAVVPTIYEVEIKALVHSDADAKILVLLAQHSKFNWIINPKAKKLVLETTEPQDPTAYSKDLENARSITNSKMIESVKKDLELISALPHVIQGTEVIGATVLSHHRFLNSFETQGLEPIKFSEPETKVISPKTRSVVALAFVLGGTIGVLGVLISSSYRNRSQNQ